MMKIIKEFKDDHNRDTTDKIEQLDMKRKSKKSDIKDWVSNVFWDNVWFFEEENDDKMAKD
ncbi:hypothetical protein BDF14DRAFT_1911583, partial [Spinellus fusiger]